MKFIINLKIINIHRNAHTPSRSIFELKKELHNTIGQLEDSTLPPLHHSPSVLIQPGSQLNDQSYYYRYLIICIN